MHAFVGDANAVGTSPASANQDGSYTVLRDESSQSRLEVPFQLVHFEAIQGVAQAPKLNDLLKVVCPLKHESEDSPQSSRLVCICSTLL